MNGITLRCHNIVTVVLRVSLHLPPFLKNLALHDYIHIMYIHTHGICKYVCMYILNTGVNRAAVLFPSPLTFHIAALSATALERERERERSRELNQVTERLTLRVHQRLIQLYSALCKALWPKSWLHFFLFALFLLYARYYGSFDDMYSK